MRCRVQLAVSAVSLATIFGGVGYGVERENLRRVNLQAVYQQVNRDSFAGQLPDIPVAWADLDDAYGKTWMFDDGTAEIRISRELVTSGGRLESTMRHEACHVAVRAEVERLPEDDHGAMFQDCMKRFE